MPCMKFCYLLVLTIAFSCSKRSQMDDNPKLFLESQLLEIEASLPNRDVLNLDVSQADVAWHLDHMLKVINGIHDAVSHSNPKEYKEDINAGRYLLFKLGRIPRGVAQSPKSVLPPKEIKTGDILSQLQLARNNLTNFDALDKNQFFKHFGFGVLNRDKAKRFLEIHTNHHLKIVRDIVNK